MTADAPPPPRASWWSGLLRTVLVYMVVAQLMRALVPSTSTPQATDGAVTAASASASAKVKAMRLAMDAGDTFSIDAMYNDAVLLHWDISFVDGIQQAANVSMDFSDAVVTNNTEKPILVVFRFRQWSINRTVEVLSRPKVRRPRQRLLNDNPENLTVVDDPTPQFVLQPRVHLNVVVEPIPFESLPPQVSAHVVTVSDNVVLPIAYVNPFWLTKSTEVIVNATHAHHDIEFNYWTLSLIKFVLYRQFEESMDMQETMGASSSAREETRRMLIETDPWLLGLTFTVSVLHLVFEYLAFSNDIAFWRQRRGYKGLSLRSVAVEFYFAVIVFLYLLDGDETSWTVLVPNGIGVLVSGWKLRRVMRIDRTDGRWSVRFKQEDSQTMTYDQRATRFLLKVMAPLLVAYAVYSAMYEEHRGWYSFLIVTQVQFIYMTGFVLMLPQIFINYRLKSVAQLPWRTFVYKALNTVIDDLFAFIVKMPLLHRIACFRDDVVFAVLLYQRWIYPVDKTRTEGGERLEEDPPSGAATVPAITEGVSSEVPAKAKAE